MHITRMQMLHYIFVTTKSVMSIHVRVEHVNGAYKEKETEALQYLSCRKAQTTFYLYFSSCTIVLVVYESTKLLPLPMNNYSFLYEIVSFKSSPHLMAFPSCRLYLFLLLSYYFPDYSLVLVFRDTNRLL